MKKEEIRTAIQEMNTYQFGQKKELTNKLSKVRSYVAKQEVLDMVSKLDKQIEEVKPELPVIPQFVADWFEQNKNSLELNIFSLIVDTNESNNQSRTEIQNWSNWEINKPIETLIRMKDGYTIEPPKTRQVLVKFFDNEEYKTELTEDAARELIEFLEANKK